MERPIYEGFFIEEQKIKEILRKIGVETPTFPKLPKNYHVTAWYKPEKPHERFYGKKVNLKIAAYKADENFGAEGLKVIFDPSDKVIASMQLPQKNFHVTLSYVKAAVDTNKVDFEKDALSINFEVEAIFNGFFPK